MDVKTVTKKALRALGEAKVPYMIVGGLAANYFGFPRFVDRGELVCVRFGLVRKSQSRP